MGTHGETSVLMLVVIPVVETHRQFKTRARVGCSWLPGNGHNSITAFEFTSHLQSREIILKKRKQNKTKKRLFLLLYPACTIVVLLCFTDLFSISFLLLLLIPTPEISSNLRWVSRDSKSIQIAKTLLNIHVHYYFYQFKWSFGCLAQRIDWQQVASNL